MRDQDCIPDIGYLEEQLAIMGNHVKNSCETAVQALLDHNAAAAQTVIDNDRIVNSYEMDIDSGIYILLSMLAVNEVELRRLLAMQKVNTCLERLGDHAVNIAESVISLCAQDARPVYLELPHMADLANRMLRDSLTCFAKGPADLAAEILTRDAAIDKLNASMHQLVKELVLREQMSFDAAMDLIRISKNLERIADLSTNIAEEAIFCRDARNVKHHGLHHEHRPDTVPSSDAASCPLLAGSDRESEPCQSTMS